MKERIGSAEETEFHKKMNDGAPTHAQNPKSGTEHFLDGLSRNVACGAIPSQHFHTKKKKVRNGGSVRYWLYVVLRWTRESPVDFTGFEMASGRLETRCVM